MDHMSLTCPECGLNMEIEMQGKASSMIVLICNRCKTPLMRYQGEIFELDKEEFHSLRSKLKTVLDALVKENLEIELEGVDKLPVWGSNSENEWSSATEIAKILDDCDDVDDFISRI